ncbi:MAG: MarR family winged helix-turn-helix transcriptional regulator [Parvibaculum sp.]|uniref:transcriptional regulator LdtR n=1 Tax=Parvibaculum sp. TaxID=2024848 RepID=UPI0032ED989B
MGMTNIKTTDAIADQEDSGKKTAYLEALTYVERLHRRLLDVIKDELDRINVSEINSVQALLLFNIGDAEMTAGELRTRGHYLGSNVSYNLKKLVEAGYIHHQRSRSDRRSVRVKLTDKGRTICAAIDDVYKKHCAMIADVADITADELRQVNATLFKLERFWTDQIRYRL